MIVIVPMVMLIVMTVIGFIVVLTGDVLQSRERTRIVYDVQTSLDRIEQDIRLANEFEPSLYVASPQGPGTSGASGTFLSTTALIVEQNATTNSPIDPARELIYLADQPNACNNQKQYNVNLKTYSIYFVQNNNLIRRSVVPTAQASCDVAWQRNSCPNGFTTTATVCRALDEVLLEGVDEFDIDYLQSIGSDTLATAPDDADAVDITLRASAQVAGESISQTGNVRASYINSTE